CLRPGPARHRQFQLLIPPTGAKGHRKKLSLSPMDATLLLQHIARHITLTADEQEYLLSLLHLKKLRRRQFLNQEGDIAKGPAFVTSGILRSYSLDAHGLEHVIQFAPPGWWIGDMNSLVNQQPGILFCDALEDSEILWLRKADL